jgi:hypothetical protein
LISPRNEIYFAKASAQDHAHRFIKYDVCMLDGKRVSVNERAAFESFGNLAR